MLQGITTTQVRASDPKRTISCKVGSTGRGLDVVGSMGIGEHEKILLQRCQLVLLEALGAQGSELVVLVHLPWWIRGQSGKVILHGDLRLWVCIHLRLSWTDNLRRVSKRCELRHITDANAFTVRRLARLATS